MKSFFFALLLLPTLTFAETWKVTSLDWPPYSGKNLKDGGAAISALRTALKNVGVTLEVEYLPWTKAIRKAKKKGYVGYYPAWPTDVVKGFESSSTLFNSPIIFVSKKGNDFNWKSLDDFKGKKVGIVRGYGYGDEFFKKVKDGTLKTNAVVSDDYNLKALMNDTIDVTLLDQEVFHYLVNFDVKEAKGQLVPFKKIQDNKSLHIAFQKSLSAEKNKKLEQALKSVDVQKLVKDYINKEIKK